MEEKPGPALQGREEGTDRRQLLPSVDAQWLWNRPPRASTRLGLEGGVGASVESP